MRFKSLQVHMPYPVLVDRISEVVDAGINPEVYIDEAWLAEAASSDLRSMGRALKAGGVVPTLHGPYKGLSPGHPNERVRRAAVEAIDKTLGAAELLGADIVVMHGMYDPIKFKGDVELWLEGSLEAWPGFARAAEELGLVIAVENIFDRGPGPLESLVRAVDSPGLRVCLDTGHINIFSRVGLEEWTRRLGPWTAEVHVHDNHGSIDEHLPLGEGEFDFRGFFTLLSEYSEGVVLTIEQHGEEAAKRGLRALKGFLDTLPGP